MKKWLVPADDADCFPKDTPIMLFLGICDTKLGEYVLKIFGPPEDGYYWAVPICNGMGDLKVASQIFSGNFEMYEIAN